MKKHIFVSTMLILSLFCMTACGKDISGQSQGDAIAEAMSTFNDPNTAETEPEVQEEKTPNKFIQNIAELPDAWSGTIAVGTLILDNNKNFSDILNIMPNTYTMAYSNIDGVATTVVNDMTLVPKSGTFEVAFAPNGCTNASDPRLIKFVFGVPYDTAKNPKQNNVGKWSIDRYKVQEVRFMVHRTDGTETGVGFTVPGFQACVSTKDDMIKAFGEQYKTAEASTSIKFHQDGTVYKDLTGNFGEDGLLTEIVAVYDVNIGEDLTALGITGSNFGNFKGFINELPSGSYYAFYRDEMKNPVYCFTANADAIDGTNLVGYSMGMYGIWGGLVHEYVETISSSQVDNMPVKISKGEYIYVADANTVMKIKIDTVDGEVEVDTVCCRVTGEDGSISYETTVGNETSVSDDSTIFDTLSAEYRNAENILFELKE